MNKETINKGDYIYIQNKYTASLRKVIYKSKNIIEFNFGWCFIDQLKPNLNKASKIKYILIEE